MRENVRENMRDYEKTEILNTPELSCGVISIIAVHPVGHASRNITHRLFMFFRGFSFVVRVTEK